MAGKNKGHNMNQYLNNDGTIKKEEIVNDFCRAADMYANGERSETKEIIEEIADVIQQIGE